MFGDVSIEVLELGGHKSGVIDVLVWRCKKP
jgi:hypothetical protein